LRATELFKIKAEEFSVRVDFMVRSCLRSYCQWNTKPEKSDITFKIL